MSEGPRLRFRGLWLAIGGLLLFVLLVLCLVPHPPEPLSFSGADKLEHATAYALLMGWYMQIYHPWRARAWVAVGLFAFGVGIEFLQLMAPPRSFEVADMAADAFGVMAAWVLARPPLTEILHRVERLFGAHGP